MSKLIVTLFLALPMMAQDFPQPAAEPDANLEAREAKPVDRAPIRISIATDSQQPAPVCSIPLVNVLPRSGVPSEKMPVIRSPRPEAFSMRLIEVPAPPCQQMAAAPRGKLQLRIPLRPR